MTLPLGLLNEVDNIDDIPQKGLQYKHAIVIFGSLQGFETALMMKC
jgi:hypothetical protein